MDWEKVPAVVRELGCEASNKRYFANRIIGDREAGLKWIKEHWIRVKIDLEALQKRIIASDGCSLAFALVQSDGRRFSYRVVDKDGKPVWDRGVEIVCQQCGRHFTLQQERELFVERAHCLCRKCRMKNVATIGGMMDTLHRVMKEKYGAEYPIQVKSIKEKTARTCKKKSGVDVPLKNKEVQKKVAKTCIERYGVDNPFKLKEFQEKSDRTWEKRYGSSNLWKTEIGERIFRRLGRFSESAYALFSNLEKKLGCKCLYGAEEKRVDTDTTSYYLDCFIEAHKAVIEFYGTYYHADPRKYAPEDLIKNKTAKEIWENDRFRENEIRRCTGCRIFVVWEDDYDKDAESTLQNLVKEITEC